jgi:hypothetical protein
MDKSFAEYAITESARAKSIKGTIPNQTGAEIVRPDAEIFAKYDFEKYTGGAASRGSCV